MSTPHILTWRRPCTHTRLTALCPVLPGRAGTRKVKPVWILLKQETVSGSSISWAICKSAPRCRQLTTPEPHHPVFLPPNQQHQSTEGKWIYRKGRFYFVRCMVQKTLLANWRIVYSVTFCWLSIVDLWEAYILLRCRTRALDATAKASLHFAAGCRTGWRKYSIYY